MLRDLVRDEGPDEIAALLSGSGRAARELARLLPELTADRPAGHRGRRPSPGRPVDGIDGAALYQNGMTAGEARAHLFEGFLTLLERLAAQRPLVLIIEDAHWADRSSRDLLAFLIGYQRAVAQPADRRDVPLRRAAPHPSAAAAAGRAGPDRLGGADRAAAAHPRAGRGARRRRPAAGRPSLASPTPSTSGPRATRCSPRSCWPARGECDAVPDTLADLLLQAVRRLPEDTQEVLRVASAGSGVTSDALLAQVTGLDARPAQRRDPPRGGGQRAGDER